MTFAPSARGTAAADQGAVPDAVPAPPVPELVQVMLVTAWLSDAFPPTSMVAWMVVKVGEDVGVSIVSVGSVASNVTSRESVDVFPGSSNTVTVIVFKPACRGMQP